MNPLKILFGISIVMVFNACDPVYLAEIKNNKKNDIIIKIGFDSDEYDKIWGEGYYTGYLRSYPNWDNIEPALDFDTINLIMTFKIETNQSFPLSSGIGEYVDLKQIKSLCIIDKDTVTIENSEQLTEAFNSKDGRHWIMEIE